MSLNQRSFTSYLRPLLSLARDYDAQSLSYRAVISPELRAALIQTVPTVFSKKGVAQDEAYTAQLLKKLVLVLFELLCASVEVVREVEYSYSEFKELLLFVEDINATNHKDSFTSREALHLEKKRSDCWSIELSSLVDVYLRTRVNHLVSALFNRLSCQNLLHWAKFETSFSRALLALIATYTSLFTSADMGLRKGREFASEDVFSMKEPMESPLSWSDCLIPGAQSEALRRAGGEVFGRLWDRVAEVLAAKCCPPLLEGSWTLDQFIPWLQKTSQSTEFDGFPVVTRCLSYVLRLHQQQLCLKEWDLAFQQYVVSCGEQYRKRYKVVRGSKSPTIATLCLKSLEPLNAFMAREIKEGCCTITQTTTPSYLNGLKQSLPAAHALRVTLDHTALTLLRNLSSNMCSWKIASLACLLFEEIPVTNSSLSHSMAVLYNTVSPRIAFLKDSGLHLLESSCTAVCSSVHATSTHLQDTLETFYGYFQHTWANQCSQLLKSSFPQAKHWKSFRKKGSSVSNYCDVLVEHLLFPMVDASTSLPPKEQVSFLYFMATTFFAEYRKVITSNKSLYSVFAGRQLLCDYRYLMKWLTASDQQLHKIALQVLSGLPIAMEMKRGLLVLCGVGELTEETDGDRNQVTLGLTSKLPSSSLFPVFNEIAWNTPHDWNNSVL